MKRGLLGSVKPITVACPTELAAKGTIEVLAWPERGEDFLVDDAIGAAREAVRAKCGLLSLLLVVAPSTARLSPGCFLFILKRETYYYPV